MPAPVHCFSSYFPTIENGNVDAKGEPSLLHSPVEQIETERRHYTYRVSGDEDGIPMLLLHGSFAGSRWWTLFLNVLPDSIRAIALDLRGSGGDQSESGYEIADQARDVKDFVEAMGLSDFDLVGHASGGAIAIEYALSAGENLRSLILVDSAPIEGVFTPLETLELLNRMRSDRALLSRALRSLMPSVPPPGMETSVFETYFALLLEDASSMPLQAYTATAEALGRWNRSDAAGQLTLPTLLVRGSEDQIVGGETATRTLLSIPGANNLEVLRGIGHSPMIEAPALLAERMIEFIVEDFEDYAFARDYAQEQSEEDENRE